MKKPHMLICYASKAHKPCRLYLKGWYFGFSKDDFSEILS